MLKGIPNTISPDLMHALMRMGHGDEIVLANESPSRGAYRVQFQGL